MTSKTEQPLSATTFEPAPVSNEAGGPPSEGGQSRAIYIGLGIGGVLLGFVFFVLPALVSTDPTGTNPTMDAYAEVAASTAGAPPKAAAQSSEGRSPFADAQESALRRDAQEVLQALLSLQESLDKRGAARWGETTYSGALARAAAGDAAYRERDFVAATAEYQRALDQLRDLEQTLPERIDALHGELIAAIESTKVLAAQARFTELAEMAPTDIRLVALEDRLLALPAVVAALDSAGDAETAGDLNAAVAAARAATGADPDHKRAAARLSELNAKLTQAQFTDAMTAGYGAMAGGAFDTAETAFRKAGRLIPGAPEPAAALVELDQSRTQAKLLALKDQGAMAEREERWPDAVELYEQARAIDALILFAIEGVVRSQPRAELDARLEKIREERDRLVDARIMRLAQETLAEATALANPGPRLQGQIAAAEATISYANTPIATTLSSDGLTDITILRFKRLGTLTERTLSLRPGVYTAVGMRNGYRDERVTFEVRPNQNNAVEIRCVEAI